jgi:hypothetical protein
MNIKTIEAEINASIESQLAQGKAVPVSWVTRPILEAHPELAGTLDVQALVLRYMRRKFEPPDTAEGYMKHAQELREYQRRRRQ